MTLVSIDPTSGETIATYPAQQAEEIRQRLRQTHEAFLVWRETSLRERAERLEALARVVRDRVDDLAALMATEMGKPVSQGRAEAKKCAWVCEHYAEVGPYLLGPKAIDTGAESSFIRFEPLGVVLAIMPWNFPFWQVFRAAVPLLMSGNAVVLKHASNVTGCALEIGRMFEAARVPEHLLTVLRIGSEHVDDVIENPVVRGVTLTGSPRAGRAVAAKAGACLKKTVLELGGSDPYLILEDADVERAARTCVASRLINSGQSCIAAKRFIVVDKNRRELTERVIELMRQAQVGAPLDEETDVGPLARVDLRDTLHQQVKRSIERGARCLLGGEIPGSPGAWYPPTVLVDVGPGMPAYSEELFGPVAAIISVANTQEAIEVANDSSYGLGAAVFSKNMDQAIKVAHHLEAGNVAVNDLVRSDPRMPFGGVKDSGYGRELSRQGLREFVNFKSIVAKHQ